MDPVKRTTICSERIKGYEMLPADTFNKHLISAHYVSDHEGKKMNKKYFCWFISMYDKTHYNIVK